LYIKFQSNVTALIEVNSLSTLSSNLN
jgi:hypothetical protein